VILRAGNSTFKYRYTVAASGVVSNNVNVGGTSLSAQTTLFPPPTNGASCGLVFTSAGGSPAAFYAGGATLFVSMTNAAANTSSNSVQSISVTVHNLTHGDVETIVLTETGSNTGVFFSSGGLPTSLSSGLGQQDGTLNVTAGDTLSVIYTDPIFGDSCSSLAVIQAPALNKVLYLSVNGSTNGVQALNRVDPVASSHSPTRASVDLGSGGGGSSGFVIFDRASSNNTSGTVGWKP
jgi:hypothetical protein